MSCSALQGGFCSYAPAFWQHVPAAGGALPVMLKQYIGLILVVSTAPRYPTCIDHKAHASDTHLFHDTKKKTPGRHSPASFIVSLSGSPRAIASRARHRSSLPAAAHISSLSASDPASKAAGGISLPAVLPGKHARDEVLQFLPDCPPSPGLSVSADHTSGLR